MSHSTVFELGQDLTGKPKYYISRKMAKDLVQRGLAKELSRHTTSIQLLTKPEISGMRGLSGRACERIAIEKFPQRCIGGLVRTETQPRNIPAFSGARVGHQ